MQEDECEVEFRVKKQDIARLAAALHLADVFKCSNGVVVGPVEALCVCLKRFAYPCRYADLIPRFGRSVPQLCMTLWLIFCTIHFLTGFKPEPTMASPQHPKMYAQAIHKQVAALDN